MFIKEIRLQEEKKFPDKTGGRPPPSGPPLNPPLFLVGAKATGYRVKIPKDVYRVFSHDVTAAILVSQNNETAAMLVSQTNPLGVELFSYANAFFCSNKFAQMLATWVKTLYRCWKNYLKIVLPWLWNPSGFQEHKHNWDVWVHLHIFHHCVLHLQNPALASGFLLNPGKIKLFCSSWVIFK